MKRHLLINSSALGSVFFLLLIGGCASQLKKSRVPASLEKEIKSIEGEKPSTTYQPPISGGKNIYIVKKGDSLWSISKNLGVSVEAILKANHIVNSKDLKVGQKLIIPTFVKSNTPLASHTNYASTRNSTAYSVSSRGFIWPVRGQIVSKFGEVRDGTKNMGIYIRFQPDQKVIAAKKGAVEAISDAGKGMHVIVIKHDWETRTIYECRCYPVVGEGSYVEQGQPIASINQVSTGTSQEIQFKIYVKDRPVNPMSYLP